ncbi:hypothetical protein [Arenibaculum pallidiluteum]|uniref:hypothetical protein n=1 Tax=Arenibaculum pallidiluteum TaxID=2812559 RepID=UPI001A97C5D4|nr:hypothetical protein [Arenibaculum pallidiluteum]
MLDRPLTDLQQAVRDVVFRTPGCSYADITADPRVRELRPNSAPTACVMTLVQRRLIVKRKGSYSEPNVVRLYPPDHNGQGADEG